MNIPVLSPHAWEAHRSKFREEDDAHAAAFLARATEWEQQQQENEQEQERGEGSDSPHAVASSGGVGTAAIADRIMTSEILSIDSGTRSNKSNKSNIDDNGESGMVVEKTEMQRPTTAKTTPITTIRRSENMPEVGENSSGGAIETGTASSVLAGGEGQGREDLTSKTVRSHSIRAINIDSKSGGDEWDDDGFASKGCGVDGTRTVWGTEKGLGNVGGSGRHDKALGVMAGGGRGLAREGEDAVIMSSASAAAVTVTAENRGR